jgi:hypothetical protein
MAQAPAETLVEQARLIYAPPHGPLLLMLPQAYSRFLDHLVDQLLSLIALVLAEMQQAHIALVLANFALQAANDRL